jgi:Ca2+-binding EF-hand superfamily protein
MEPSLQDLQQIFEYELKRKLSQRAKISSDEMKILLNVFRFFDLNYTGIINKNQWIQGILRTGLTGFSVNDLDSLFSFYDKNNSGQIDYKNFCGFLYGREQLNPLSNNEQSLILQKDDVINNNINNTNRNQQNQENESEGMNINNNNLNQFNNFSKNNKVNLQKNEQNLNYNDINNTSQGRQNISLYNNINNQRNYINYNKNNNYGNNQRTPLNNNEYRDNSNFRQNQKKINSYNNTFNNIFQQQFSPEYSNISTINNNTNNLSKYKNRSQYAINSIISSIKNSINTNNGITLYTFIKNLKNRQSNNSISIKELNNIFKEMRLNFVLNDLQTLFNALNRNQNNNIFLWIN